MPGDEEAAAIVQVEQAAAPGDEEMAAVVQVEQAATKEKKRLKEKQRKNDTKKRIRARKMCAKKLKMEGSDNSLGCAQIDGQSAQVDDIEVADA